MLQPPPRTTLFPYTTLFRSAKQRERSDKEWLSYITTQSHDTNGINSYSAPHSRLQAWWKKQEASHINDKRKLLLDRKSTRLNSSHPSISYAVFCLKKKTIHT